MKLNLITTKEILDFEKEIGYELVVNERAIHVGSPARLSKYYVQFENAEMMEGVSCWKIRKRKYNYRAFLIQLSWKN